jgi:hypothetical protein
MNFRHILPILYLLVSFCGSAQTKPFTENSKWGIKEDNKVIVEAIYDTIFNFDSTGKVCLACFKTRTASANKFIKLLVTTYSCNYLNKKRKRLSIKTPSNDTCTVFAYAKNSIKQYNHSNNYLVATVKGKKYLADKNFKQLTFKPYQEISPSADPNFYVTQVLNEWDTPLTGLVDANEKQIIPYQYSDIKVNPYDSLIIGCSAGLRPNAIDDIYFYSGKKRETCNRHVDMATKNFIIHKIYEPKEHYVLYNSQTKEEKSIEAEELHVQPHDEVLIKVKGQWFVYNLATNTQILKTETPHGKNKGRR